jgi:hypothetical protein
MKKYLQNFIINLIKDRLLDIIDDRTYDDRQEIEGVRRDLEDCQHNLESELYDKPNFYDMETQVEELVNNEMADVIERLEKLESKIES